jgi:hypothetical protein
LSPAAAILKANAIWKANCHGSRVSEFAGQLAKGLRVAKAQFDCHK